MRAAGSVATRIRAAFDAVGVRGWLHVQDIADGAREVDVDAGHRLPIASLVKLHVAVAIARAVDAGTLSPTARVRVGARRTAGPTGLAAMRDPVAISVRDLAFLMLSISDNAACDALFDLVGADAVAAVPDALGLRGTVVRGTLRDLLDSIPADLEADPGEVPVALARPGALGRLRALDPARTTSSTARDLTRLLRMVWRDEAASPAGCAELRRVLGLQVWPHRLAAGFPEDDVVVSGKTGTLPGFRAEAGVIELPTDRAYAAAVVTRSDQAALNHPRADAAIGATARMAVMALEQR